MPSTRIKQITLMEKFFFFFSLIHSKKPLWRSFLALPFGLACSVFIYTEALLYILTIISFYLSKKKIIWRPKTI